VTIAPGAASAIETINSQTPFAVIVSDLQLAVVGWLRIRLRFQPQHSMRRVGRVLHQADARAIGQRPAQDVSRMA
jgi:hypothetical protein